MFNPQQKDLSCPEVSGNNSDKCAILIHPTTSHIGESEELATLTLPPQGERIEFEGKKKRPQFGEASEYPIVAFNNLPIDGLS